MSADARCVLLKAAGTVADLSGESPLMWCLFLCTSTREPSRALLYCEKEFGDDLSLIFFNDAGIHHNVASTVHGQHLWPVASSYSSLPASLGAGI